MAVCASWCLRLVVCVAALLVCTTAVETLEQIVQSQLQTCQYMSSTKERDHSFVDPHRLATHISRVLADPRLSFEYQSKKTSGPPVSTPHKCKNFDFINVGTVNRFFLLANTRWGWLNEHTGMWQSNAPLKRRVPQAFALHDVEEWNKIATKAFTKMDGSGQPITALPKTTEELRKWRDPAGEHVLALYGDGEISQNGDETKRPALIKSMESKLKYLPGTAEQKRQRFLNSYVFAEVLQRLSMRDVGSDSDSTPFYVTYGDLKIYTVQEFLDLLEILGHRIRAMTRTEHASGEYKTLASPDFLRTIGLQTTPSRNREYVDVPYVENVDVAPLLRQHGMLPDLEGTLTMPTLHGEIMIEVSYEPKQFADYNEATHAPLKQHQRKMHFHKETLAAPYKRDFSFTAEVHQDPNIAQFYANDRFIRPKWFGCKRHYKSGGLGRHIDVRLENFEAKRMITLASEYVYTINRVGKNFFNGGYFVTGVCMDFAAVVQNAMLNGFIGLNKKTVTPMLYPLMNDPPTIQRLIDDLKDRKARPIKDKERIRPSLADALMGALETHTTDLLNTESSQKANPAQSVKAPFPSRALRAIPFPQQEMPFDMHRASFGVLRSIVGTSRADHHADQVAADVSSLQWFGSYCREGENGFLEDISENVLEDPSFYSKQLKAFDSDSESESPFFIPAVQRLRLSSKPDDLDLESILDSIASSPDIQPRSSMTSPKSVTSLTAAAPNRISYSEYQAEYLMSTLAVKDVKFKREIAADLLEPILPIAHDWITYDTTWSNPQQFSRLIPVPGKRDFEHFLGSFDFVGKSTDGSHKDQLFRRSDTLQRSGVVRFIELAETETETETASAHIVEDPAEPVVKTGTTVRKQSEPESAAKEPSAEDSLAVESLEEPFPEPFTLAVNPFHAGAREGWRKARSKTQSRRQRNLEDLLLLTQEEFHNAVKKFVEKEQKDFNIHIPAISDEQVQKAVESIVNQIMGYAKHPLLERRAGEPSIVQILAPDSPGDSESLTKIYHTILKQLQSWFNKMRTSYFANLASLQSMEHNLRYAEDKRFIDDELLERVGGEYVIQPVIRQLTTEHSNVFYDMLKEQFGSELVRNAYRSDGLLGDAFENYIQDPMTRKEMLRHYRFSPRRALKTKERQTSMTPTRRAAFLKAGRDKRRQEVNENRGRKKHQHQQAVHRLSLSQTPQQEFAEGLVEKRDITRRAQQEEEGYDAGSESGGPDVQQQL
eukprot:GILJ01002228.1.p1 GENE.GILJ01002228.1~~GILJ01002228.1.p1  ORF type:complete len:1226 (+),score=203.49 GILJ01002228.1:49-3726(+)